MIEVRGLTKRFDDFVAVDDISFTVRPGVVTGFLGPNGAGKTTTLRMILGLAAPTSGTVTFDGLPFSRLPAPLRQIGALLDARAVHPSRTASQHLRALARSNGIDPRRVREVLRMVGLERAANRPSGNYSLGMLQRLGLAGALLGNPPFLVLDEPLNGLDPEGIIWFRRLVRRLADEGRAVLVSSHLMSEMALTADRLLIIGGGRLLVDTSIEEFVEENAKAVVTVRSPRATDLARMLSDAGAGVLTRPDGTLEVSGLTAARVGAVAASDGIELHELTQTSRSLEQAFLELTGEPVEEAADEDVDAPTGVDVDPEHLVPVAAAGTPPRPATFRDSVASEWMKLWSSRSTKALVAGTVLAGAGLGILAANALGAQYPTLSEEARAAFDPTAVSLRGSIVAQLTIGLLGAVLVTAEYGTGTIATSLAAVPDRSKLLASKVAVLIPVALATGLAVTLGGFLGGQAVLGRHAVAVSLADPEALRAVLGGSLHLTASALLGLGVGTLTRSTSASVSTLFGATLIIPAFAPTLPGELARLTAKYWPTQAGGRVMAVLPDPNLLDPWTGLGVMAATSVAVLAAAFRAFRRRDV
jgi:ABC-2 type transport system ATP-binding protein